ncbi:AAA family ATPase [Nonomuraea sp. PA05]|uniref:BTAD domain-containing putative transcriptional regulator n=1 Tax=Nonomuraea sp. PA05 TaxID=2604466 RepID=UPI0011D2F6A4|nr:BTAD domain-containing putative transcriptional regulator [Nonomuraea sp. PA05]TYB55377.1 AAA family ATPase [Nonomuraea sp. PA05]
MRFGILGDTRAWRDDGAEVPLGGPARRALLALLLVRPGAVVPAERLAAELGPAGVPSAHALHSQVSRLRACLGAEAPIERAGAGYRLLAADEDVDACRFERLAAEGRAALGSGEVRRAVTALTAALALWRGAALAGLPDSERARAAAVRLEESRIGALEDRIEAELLLGEHRAVVPELRELVERHPLRERPAGLLMRALSAGGERAEALVVFEETRRRLAGELGADPSAELAELHLELLSAGPSPAPTPPPAQLTSFVGRDDEMAEITELLRVTRLVTLTGPGGVGKTRLSVELAATADGEVCFAELAPLRDGTGLAQTLLNALGLRQNGLQLADGPRTPVERLVSALSDRPLLLVLDNCEHLVDDVAALVARLLATGPRLRVLATSREPLGIIGENIRQVRPLNGEAAARLFTDRARAARRGFVPDPTLVRRICAALDDLPLAVELAAARLRTLDLDDLAGRLDDLLGVAARGNRTPDQRHRTLRSVVAWSWALLSAGEQRAARRFTVFAGGATAGAAVAVCGTDEETLESLVDKSLLEAVGGGRLRMLETIRAYGAERLNAAGEREAARRAHARYYLDLARTADPWLRRAEQLDWLPALAAEHDNLMAALRRSVAARDVETALRLIGAISTYLWIRGVSASAAPHAITLLGTIGDTPPPGLGEEYATCVLVAASTTAGRPAWRRHRAAAGEALAAAWPGDRSGRHPAALLLWIMHNASEAEPHDAYELVAAQRDNPDPWARATSLYVTGFGHLGGKEPDPAEHAFHLAADGYRALGDRWGTALALDVLAGLAAGRGDRARAVELTDEALALTDELGALEDSADLLVNRGDHLAAEDPEAAGADYARAAGLARRAGSPAGLSAALRGLGDLALARGELGEAERLYTDALERIDPHWVKSVGNRVRTLAGLGRVAEARGDQVTARDRYRQSAASASAIGASVPDALRLLGLPEPLVAAVLS